MRTKLTLITLVLALVGLGSALPAQAGDRPENGRITFGRADPALDGYSIWAANPDGSHQQRLTNLPSFFSDWSPDGRRIAFDFLDDSGVHIATMGPNGGHVRQLTFGPAVQEVPKWSPDGRWITFDAAPTFGPDFRTSIWIMRADGSGARQLTDDGFDVEPVWSPDGRRIAFGRITGINDQGDQLEALYVVNSDGTGLRQVLSPRPGLEHPDWSPDGRWISFNIAPESAAAPNAGSIMVVHPNGKGLHVLRRPTDRLEFFKPVWSPDGRKLLVGCFDTQAHVDQLCVMKANGGNVHAIIVGTPEEPVNFPAWGSHPPKH